MGGAMRRIPIDEPNEQSTRVQVTSWKLATELAEKINNADKPASFPRATVHVAGPLPPRVVSIAATAGLATALVLDMLESGDIRMSDLIERAATLAETNPAKAVTRKQLRQWRREQERLSKREADED